jgi:hypothetical protein
VIHVSVPANPRSQADIDLHRHCGDGGPDATTSAQLRGSRLGNLLEANRADLLVLLSARPELRVITISVLLAEATTWCL